MPDQVRALEASLASVKDKFAKGDYKAVLAEAPAIAGRAKEVAAASAAKKAELTKTLGGDERRPPEDGGGGEVAGRHPLEEQEAARQRHQGEVRSREGRPGGRDEGLGGRDAAFKGGNVADAVARADAVKQRTVEALEALGMPVPAAAKS